MGEIIATAVGSGVTVLLLVAGVFRYAVRAELSAFELSFMQRLNGTYTRSEVINEKLKAIDQQLGSLDEHGCSRFKEHRFKN